MEAAAAGKKTYKYRVHDQMHMQKWTVAEWLDFSTMKRPPTDSTGGAQSQANPGLVAASDQLCTAASCYSVVSTQHERRRPVVTVVAHHRGFVDRHPRASPSVRPRADQLRLTTVSVPLPFLRASEVALLAAGLLAAEGHGRAPAVAAVRKLALRKRRCAIAAHTLRQTAQSKLNPNFSDVLTRCLQTRVHVPVGCARQAACSLTAPRSLCSRHVQGEAAVGALAPTDRVSPRQQRHRHVDEVSRWQGAV
jgi:hypothetical protein